MKNIATTFYNRKYVKSYATIAIVHNIKLFSIISYVNIVLLFNTMSDLLYSTKSHDTEYE